ncbi:MAG: hypothetical protein ACI95C_002987, partial [Pseudohongiellaceae bacterium]
MFVRQRGDFKSTLGIREETPVKEFLGKDWLMAMTHKKLAMQWTSATILLLAEFVFAQESDQASAEAEETRSSRLYFIDQPMALEPVFDDSVTLPVEQSSAPDEDDPEFRRRMATIAQYSEAVRATELDGGAWDSGLAEDLAVLGGMFQLQGDHAQAIETFDRVVHISRINNGLHSIEQIPAVEQMIESYLATSDWEKADLYYNYLFYIQDKAFGRADPRMIPVLDRLAKWNLRAFNIGFDEKMGARLSTAQILFGAAARMVDTHFGKSDERFTIYQRNIANSAYLISKHPDLVRDLNSVEYRMNEEMLRRKILAGNQVSTRGFQTGANALSEILDFQRQKGGSPLALAEAIADLADWHLIFQQRRTAAELYAEAWQILSETQDSEELLASFFGQVVPLPTFLAAPTSLVFKSSSARDTSELRVGYADLVFDVTENGVVRNL